MSNILKISACFLCGAGIGLLLYWHWEKECECPGEEENLSSGLTKDSKRQMSAIATPPIMQQPPPLEKQSIAAVTENQPKVETSLPHRWATRQGVMEIAQELVPRQSQKANIFEKLATREGVMEVATKELPVKETAQTIIERWGTRQGVIDLATATEHETQKQAKAMHQQRKIASQAAAEYTEHLKENFDVVQLSIRNTSNEDRDITIGADSVVSPPLPGDVEDHQVIANAATGVHPQGVIVNPFNWLIYVANQLSGTVTVATPDGIIQRTINLQSTLYPGLNSPVALAVNTIPESPHYGKVYVVNSVADTVSIINTNFEVTKQLPAGLRPVAIAFNPINEMLYVANLASGNVTVINPATEEVAATLPAGHYPRAIAINAENGDIYIVNSGANSVTVYDRNNQLLTFINNLGNRPVAIAWHPALRKMYVVTQTFGQLIPINPDTYTQEDSLYVGPEPQSIIVNPANELLYISLKESNTLAVVDGRTNAVTTVPAPGVNIGLAVHPNQNIFWTSTSINEVQVLGFAEQTSSVEFDVNDLKQLLSYFRHNPAMLQHLKIVVTGEKILGQLKVGEKTISGKKNERSVSLSNYRSPQHFQNVYEVDALKGLVMDGSTRWGFALPANHSATMLVYYKPLEKGELLNTLIKNNKNNFLCQN